MGISRDGCLVYINSSASNIFGNIRVGKELRYCFEKGIVDSLMKAIKEQMEYSIDINMDSQRYKAHVSPLSCHSSDGGGIILTLIPYE